MKVGMVVLNYNDWQSVASLLSVINNYSCIDKIVVVDNLSTDNSFDELKKIINEKCILLSSDRNGGYSYGNNIGIKYLINNYQSDIIFIVNPDVCFEEDLLLNIITCFRKNKNYAVLTGVMHNTLNLPMRMSLKIPNYVNTILDCSFIGRKINQLCMFRKIDYNKEVMEVETVPGSLWGIRSKILEEIDFLDENVFLFYEENILGFKMMKLGYREGILTGYSYLHKHSVSIKKSLDMIKGHKIYLKSKYYFEKKYRKLNKVQDLFLRVMIKYSLLEMVLLANIKDRLKR